MSGRQDHCDDPLKDRGMTVKEGKRGIETENEGQIAVVRTQSSRNKQLMIFQQKAALSHHISDWWMKSVVPPGAKCFLPPSLLSPPLSRCLSHAGCVLPARCEHTGLIKGWQRREAGLIGVVEASWLQGPPHARREAFVYAAARNPAFGAPPPSAGCLRRAGHVAAAGHGR